MTLQKCLSTPAHSQQGGSALCQAAHLSNLKAVDKKVAELCLSTPDQALGQELLAADHKIWSVISELLARSWSLDDALHEVTVMRNGLPRPVSSFHCLTPLLAVGKQCANKKEACSSSLPGGPRRRMPHAAFWRRAGQRALVSALVDAAQRRAPALLLPPRWPCQRGQQLRASLAMAGPSGPGRLPLRS